MSEQTKIAWCDSTLNFWEGCTKVSAGCANCYAEARDKRFTGGKLWGKGAPRRKSKSAVKDALAYNRKPWISDLTGEAFSNDDVEIGLAQFPNGFHRRRIFSLSLGDWLDEEVPIEWLAEMLDIIRQCDQVTWILCTKRPENWRERLSKAAEWCRIMENSENQTIDESPTAYWIEGWLAAEHAVGKVPANIILLTSVENQEAADKRIPELLRIPAACRGLSMEPLLGVVDLSGKASWGNPHNSNTLLRPILFDLDWLIIGGESGTNARPCNVDWIRSIVAQGKAAGVATFVKQLGAKPILPRKQRLEKTLAGEKFFATYPWVLTDKKGGDINEWPTDLRVQEWPKGF